MLENFRLTVFRAVAAQRSFRRAAEQLYLSQPAVTQQIKAVEELVGLPLFDRSGREVTLTAAGAVLLKYTEQSGTLLEQASVELASLKGEISGTLRIAASTTIAQYIVPPLLGAFLRLHPAVHVELESSNTESVADAIASGRATLGLVEGPPHASQVRSEVWLGDELVLLVPPSHEWAGQRSITLQQIAAAPLLMRERGSGTREVIETTLEAAGLHARDLHIAIELNSTEAILGCIESGVGVGFVSRSAIQRQLAMGTLVIVPVAGLTIPRNLLLLTPAGPDPAGAAAAMVELLRQHRAQLRRSEQRRAPARRQVPSSR
jgi:DNA-binding transcriptional LysR family regulator